MRKHASLMALFAGALLLSLSACSKHPPGAEAPATTPPAASQRPVGSTLAIAGQLFTGQDAGAIRAYLESVREVKPTSFDVRWNPATVAVSREAAMRSLRSISLDGSTFRFLTSEPAVATLKVGSILWVWDIAVRKVDHLGAEGDVTVVHTQPVALNEALTDAHIAFDSAVSLPDYYVGYARHERKPAAKTTAARRPSGFVLVVNENPPTDGPQGDPADSGTDDDAADEDSFKETRPSHGGWSGELKGFEYSLAYDTRPTGVTLTLEAANAEGGSGSAGAPGAKELFETAKDNLDVRFRARVDLDNFAVAGLLDIKSGNLEDAKAQFKQLNGKLDLAFIGRWGKPGNGAIKVPVMKLPIAFNIPFPIGGLPFVIQLGSDFLVNVFLAGNNASQSFHGAFVFSGSGGIQTANSVTSADSTMTGQEPEVKQQQAMSPGVSALVLGVQVPRLGFGFGVAGMSSVAYMDVVTVLTMTNSAAVSIGFAPPCKRVSLASTGHVGISTNIVPWPIPYVADTINDALSTKPKEIFKKEKVVLDPPIKACEI